MVASLKKSRDENELKPGQLFSAEVKDLASDGRGVVTHPNGRTFFIAGVWLGERGRFRITALKGRIGFAEIFELDAQSVCRDRVQALCDHHGFSSRHCGGCPWQFMDYAAQLSAKQHRVETSLARIGVHKKIQAIAAAPEIFGYRNRAQFKTDGKKLGYMAAASNNLVAIQQCPVLSEHNQNTLHELLQQLPNPVWQPHRKHKWTTLDIDESVTAENPAINQRLPFQQANSVQNCFMLQWLRQHLQSGAQGKHIVELFCGSGNLTQVLATLGAASILAVDVVAQALETLSAMNLPGVQSRVCDVFDDTRASDLRAPLRNADILVLDPPRDGWKTRELAWPKQTALQKICYISCDLATFTRDLQFFLSKGFHVDEVQPLDQFPHTPHIELLAALRRG